MLFRNKLIFADEIADQFIFRLTRPETCLLLCSPGAHLLGGNLSSACTPCPLPAALLPCPLRLRPTEKGDGASETFSPHPRSNRAGNPDSDPYQPHTSEKAEALSRWLTPRGLGQLEAERVHPLLLFDARAGILSNFYVATFKTTLLSAQSPLFVPS